MGKASLIVNLLTLFQNPDTRFKVASTLPLAGKFEEELQRFSLKTVTLNSNDPEAWRENPNDDLVFALALATWRANEYLPKPPAMREGEDRLIREGTAAGIVPNVRANNRRQRIGETRADGAVLRKTSNVSSGLYSRR